MGPKCCIYAGNVTTEANIGMMQPQAKECLQPQAAGGGKEQVLL